MGTAAAPTELLAQLLLIPAGCYHPHWMPRQLPRTAQIGAAVTPWAATVGRPSCEEAPPGGARTVAAA